MHLHPNRFLKKLLAFCREGLRLRFHLTVTAFQRFTFADFNQWGFPRMKIGVHPGEFGIDSVGEFLIYYSPFCPWWAE